MSDLYMACEGKVGYNELADPKWVKAEARMMNKSSL